MKYIVTLVNEDGEPVDFTVKRAGDKHEAIRKAWRQYRELSYVDDEEPPYWTRPKVREA
jgi:hypothetical protein